MLPQRQILLKVLDKDDNVVDYRNTLVRYHASFNEWVVFREFNSNGVFKQFILCFCYIDLDELKYHMHDIMEVKEINYYLCASDKTQYKITKILEAKCAEYRAIEKEVLEEMEENPKVHYAQDKIDVTDLAEEKEDGHSKDN